VYSSKSYRPAYFSQILSKNTSGMSQALIRSPRSCSIAYRRRLISQSTHTFFGFVNQAFSSDSALPLSLPILPPYSDLPQLVIAKSEVSQSGHPTLRFFGPAPSLHAKVTPPLRPIPARGPQNAACVTYKSCVGLAALCEKDKLLRLGR